MLEELDVFPSLNFIQHSHTKLKFLELKGWAKLSSLPDEIQHFTVLETLCIDGFNGIETYLSGWATFLPLKNSEFGSAITFLPLKIAHIPEISM